MKQQVLIIHGGNTFDSQEQFIDSLKTKVINLEYLKYAVDWKATLTADLGSDYEVFVPKMPNNAYAKYDEWKIWFERITELLNNNLILIGYSLGGIFLAKYLSENNLPNKIKALILVAAPFTDTNDESLASFRLTKALNNVSLQTDKILLAQSLDDPCVQANHVDMYKKELPNAQVMMFKDRGHFWQEHFPELADWFKNL